MHIFILSSACFLGSFIFSPLSKDLEIFFTDDDKFFIICALEGSVLLRFSWTSFSGTLSKEYMSDCSIVNKGDKTIGSSGLNLFIIGLVSEEQFDKY